MKNVGVIFHCFKMIPIINNGSWDQLGGIVNIIIRVLALWNLISKNC